MTRPIFHAAMLDRLRDFYPSLVTIQTRSESQDATTGEITVAWVDYAGHVGLPCSFAPAGVQEIRRADQTFVTISHTIALPAAHPDITEAMRAVVDGNGYDIVLAEVSSHGLVTRLGVRKVE